MRWAPAIVFTGPALLSKILEKRHREALSRHPSHQSLCEVPWQDFESMVVAYYREQGCGELMWFHGVTHRGRGALAGNTFHTNQHALTNWRLELPALTEKVGGGNPAGVAAAGRGVEGDDRPVGQFG